MIINVNGKLIDEDKAVVSVYDHGFLYGIGLFETFRTYNGLPFLLDEHMIRITAGCQQLGIGYTADRGEWLRIIKQLLDINGLSDAYIRFTVTAGTDILGLPGEQYSQPNVIVYIKHLPPRDEDLYLAGKPLQLLRLPRNTPEGAGRLKSLHYLNNILANRELSQYPWAAQAEGLFTDAQGFLAEGIVSNLFFCEDGRVCTPALDNGILPGVTRALVLRLAAQAGIAAEEGWYTWADLICADEVFITNSVQEIIPISTLYNTVGMSQLIGAGKAGELTRHLIQMYREHIEYLVNEGEKQ
ncbi:aminodeoxychorismate lyase [Paenibacillus xerothermodurans]|uniref:4-amino-4-deoxychorismate lyase n=1 Tax=Paenibacillus xerothermodurans TaxID=1977292 RepID=A0A2W1NU74_PAEXE|nr:aminodeoxychorismate lyase [Paenibacillus xerothermodurans]PZE19232.1 4-amino-4-deoxychorismate lyase [Paenibacillus xerothermodurans]